MFRHNVAVAGLLAAAVAVILLAAGPVAAQQQGWPLNRGGYNGYYQGGSGSAPGYVAPAETFPAFTAPFAAPAVAPAAPATEVRSFYPSAVGEQYGALSTGPASNRPVRINVSVRPDATISFGEHKTTQSGSTRAFVSPPLAPRRDYTYDLTVRWQEGGREVTRTRHITVHAGDVISLSF
jgi:uncharacterized protein (TIGR03000 family)